MAVLTGSLSEAESASVPVLTIDGLAATGKTSVCVALAQRLGWSFLLSGMLYRFIGWQQLQGVSLLAAVERAASLQFTINKQEQAEVLFEDQNVAALLDTESVAMEASHVARLMSVRADITRICRAHRLGQGLVAEGRDMGSVVFPQACLKVFLEADFELRVQRRQAQLQNLGQSTIIENVSRQIAHRDGSDKQRIQAHGDLSADTLVIDTTDLTAVQVCARIQEALSARV